MGGDQDPLGVAAQEQRATGERAQGGRGANVPSRLRPRSVDVTRWRGRPERGTMESMKEVSVRPLDLDRLAAILPADRAERFVAAAERARSAFGDRVVWHVNATAHGGG